MTNENCEMALPLKERGWFGNPVRREDWSRGGLTREQALECAFQGKSAKPGFSTLLEEMWQWPSSVADTAVEEEPLSERFHRLADEWSKDIASISSLDAMVSHPNYQEIIKLGWDVVPYLLTDLQQNKRFWFPALAEITKIRPFDLRDAGNGKRMIEAW